MARSYVFLVHGVGKQPVGADGRATWAEPWKVALLEELCRYAPYDGLTPEEIEAEHLCFWPVSYDAVFEDGFRKVWGNAGDILTDTTVVLPAPVRAAVAWAVEGQADEDARTFFWEFALDALLWSTLGLAHAAVKARVAKQLVAGVRAMVRENGAADRAHIVAHSLGTSVVHDTLVALTRETALHEGVLDPSQFRWQSITMVANVSRLLESAVDVSPGAQARDFEAHRSIVRPDRHDSCCRAYLNVRHRMDPITWPRPFHPDWPRGPIGRSSSTGLPIRPRSTISNTTCGRQTSTCGCFGPSWGVPTWEPGPSAWPPRRPTRRGTPCLPPAPSQTCGIWPRATTSIPGGWSRFSFAPTRCSREPPGGRLRRGLACLCIHCAGRGPVRVADGRFATCGGRRRGGGLPGLRRRLHGGNGVLAGGSRRVALPRTRSGGAGDRAAEPAGAPGAALGPGRGGSPCGCRGDPGGAPTAQATSAAGATVSKGSVASRGVLS